MSGQDDPGRSQFSRLAQLMVDDILDASDAEILAEYQEEGGDPDKLAADMRERLGEALIKARKGRLAAARAGLTESRFHPPTRGAVTPQVKVENARETFARVLAERPREAGLMLAARKEGELSDEDLLGMLEDLAELGIPVPKNGQG